MPRRKKIVEEKPKIVQPKGRGPQLLRGMKDILPAEQKFWSLLRHEAERLAKDYGFDRIETPILEETSLFTRAVGKQTDIVEKEMFSFEDQGKDNIALRPEATASIVRAYTNHGMANQPQPVKLFYWGPMFRHERPQSGRQRQFHQAGFEILGEKHPIVDALLILVAFNFYKDIGLSVNIQINSLGCSICRPKYKEALVNYYRSHRSELCEDCKKRLAKNPLRLLDCKEEGCQALKNEAPQIMDWLCEECKPHFVKVLEYLEEMQVPYILNPALVRGLDYYTKTVFEVWAEGDEGATAQNALGGGGRYDDLVEIMGGRSTPAAGFSLGIERSITKIKDKGVAVPDLPRPDVFIAQLGEPAKKKSIQLFEELRREGIGVSESFSKEGLKPQLEIANRIGAKFALILGQKELVDGTIMIRDMDAGNQEIVDFKKIVKEVKKRLGLNGEVKPVEVESAPAPENLKLEM